MISDDVKTRHTQKYPIHISHLYPGALQGGLRGIVWVDSIQMLIVLAAGLANWGAGVMAVGGMPKVWDLCDQGNRLKFPRWGQRILYKYQATQLG